MNNVTSTVPMPVPRVPKGKDLASRLHQWSILGAIILLATAALNLTGWALAIATLKHPIPGDPSLQSATSICFSVVCWVCLGVWWQPAPLVARVTARICAVVVFVTAALNLCEHFFRLDWSLSFPLWTPNDSTPLTFPGPIAPDVSTMLIVLSLALFLIDFQQLRQKFWSYQALCVALLLPNLLILIGYISGNPHLCLFFGCVRFSVITACAFLLACSTAFFLRPNDGLAALFASDTTSGALARRVCIWLTPLLPLAAVVRYGESIKIEETPLLTDSAGGALLSIGLIVCAGIGLLPLFKKVDKLEMEKDEVEKRLASTTTSSKVRMKSVCLECTKEYQDEKLTHCPDDGARLQKVIDDLQPGDFFAEKYQIQKRLGSGGMSAVYLAKNLLVGHLVAIKIVHAQLASEPKYIQRFRREAQATSNLSHTNIVRTSDFGISERGQAYLVMEYLQGESLSDRIHNEGQMNGPTAVAIFLQVCQGLDYAHQHGLVHRDLKPANVMLIDDPALGLTAKVVDFGLVKSDEESMKLTKTGEVFGSPLYMSPEQCRGEPADKRSDIYSLGIMMYETICGSPPFVGADVYASFLMHLSKAPIPLSQRVKLPAWLDEIILRCLAKDPDQRPQSAHEIYNALFDGMQRQSALQNQHIPDSPESEKLERNKTLIDRSPH